MEPYDVNSEGTIYYGTSFDNIFSLDTKRISTPFKVKEMYISISISGYRGTVPINAHEDIVFLAGIYTNDYKAANICNNYLHFLPGYSNSLTSIDGFGPNKLGIKNCFGKKENHTNQSDFVTAVINSKFASMCKIPSIENTIDNTPFEYISLALHSFIEYIDPKMIVGWIVSDVNYKKVNQLMSENKLVKRHVWSVDNI
jgi:hypothetical protein